MPTTTDLIVGTIYQSNNGDKWIVKNCFQEEDQIMVTLEKIKVVETIENINEPELDNETSKSIQ